MYDCKLEIRVRGTNDGSNDETDYRARDGAKNDVHGNEPPNRWSSRKEDALRTYDIREGLHRLGTKEGNKPLKHFLESDGLSKLGKDQAGKQKREDQLYEKETVSKFAFLDIK